MPVDERDLRMVVVAFEDAVTWCATLADTAETLIASATSRRPMSQVRPAAHTTARVHKAKPKRKRR